MAQNARLFAAVAQAMDDAMIGVFDAKYRYNFWRPVTAILNGDADGHEATERDAAWTPFVEAPMHPEYPSAHSILAGAVGAVLLAELGDGPVPVLSTASPTANGAVRRWTSVDAFIREVSNARVCDRGALPHVHRGRREDGQADRGTGGDEAPAGARVERPAVRGYPVEVNGEG